MKLMVVAWNPRTYLAQSSFCGLHLKRPPVRRQVVLGEEAAPGRTCRDAEVDAVGAKGASQNSSADRSWSIFFWE